MRALLNTFWFSSSILIMVMCGALIVGGIDSIHYYKQLQLSKVTPTEILDKLNGCRIVYTHCEVKVVGSDPRVVAGKFNGVTIHGSKEPYKF